MRATIRGKRCDYEHFAAIPDGNFVYALDLASNRVFRYAKVGSGSYETNIVSNGQQLVDGFVQLIINADGSFLFGPVSEATESPRIVSVSSESIPLPATSRR
jgi:hypothetical protein